MKHFTKLYSALDRTTRTNNKVSAMEAYFRSAPDADAAWALYFLSGQTIKRSISSPLTRVWASEAAQIPDWLMAECYDTVGDLAETLSLLVAPPASSIEIALHTLIEERILPLRALSEEERHTLMTTTWSELGTQECFVFNKLISGGFRVGVSKTLVIRALANVAGIPPTQMAHRLMGNWYPTAESYRSLLSKEGTTDDPTRPYPFYLAYPLEAGIDSLGETNDWQAEYKWDGIRSQLIVRDSNILLWSRGEELITDRFPEINAAAQVLPNGTAIDGELLAWKDARPLPFGYLQQRIGRKKLDKNILARVPVVMMMYDVLEWDGKDIREQPLSERTEHLLQIPNHDALKISEPIPFTSWKELTDLREQSRNNAVEGVMLKKKSSAYKVGRVKGEWWKWKIDPYHIDAVLIYAQKGHGRRAELFTDYTFGVYDEHRVLVPIAKAYSGLTDEEIRKVDRFIRDNTLERFGPVRTVKPQLVFELAFEGIQESTRHKAGIALRFPRMARWRTDKPLEEADTLETVRAILQSSK